MSQGERGLPFNARAHAAIIAALDDDHRYRHFAGGVRHLPVSDAVRGTRAAPMLVGVAAVALGFYIAGWDGLTTLSWLVSTLLPYVVFALIVVFQAELRHALANLGSRLTMSRAPSSESDAYDDIVWPRTCFRKPDRRADRDRARDRVANLHRERRAHGCADFLRPAGNYFPAQRSPPRWSGDRAEDRIAAAACFLPLSMNPVCRRRLGTRHRAGIGITEETDSIALIVSEESGAISLAVSGISSAI